MGCNLARLIIVNGKPASGKTTLTRRLKSDVHVPVLGKDDIKEFLFDMIGTKDRQWSQLVGRASADMLYDFAATFLAEGKDVLIENAFWSELARTKYQDLLTKTNSTALELYCQASQEVRRERNKARIADDDRHTGHVDQLLEINDSVDDVRYAPLVIGEVTIIDTVKLDDSGYTSIVQRITQFLSR